MTHVAENIKEKGSIKGVYTFTKAKLVTPEHFAMSEKIAGLRNNIARIVERKGVWAFMPVALYKAQLQSRVRYMQSMVALLHRMCETEVSVYENLIPTVGRAMIANNLTDSTPTNPMVITHAELGSSTTAPANGDTALGTPVYRNAIASLTNVNNIGYVSAFFSALETSGTFKEAGVYSDGTGTLGTGVLFSHVAVNITKSTSETLTIDWQFTIN